MNRFDVGIVVGLLGSLGRELTGRPSLHDDSTIARVIVGKSVRCSEELEELLFDENYREAGHQ